METSAKDILIVHDSPTNRKLLRVTLEAEGYVAIEAADCREALQILARKCIDVVVSMELHVTKEFGWVFFLPEGEGEGNAQSRDTRVLTRLSLTPTLPRWERELLGAMKQALSSASNPSAG
jgi:ActR/RegA family two-component response regulator